MRFRCDYKCKSARPGRSAAPRASSRQPPRRSSYYDSC